MTVRIAFVNKATISLDVEMSKLVGACQVFLDTCFVPVWGYPALLRATDKPDSNEWQIVFLDTADEANALGYHDLTDNGQPISKVFVKTTKEAKQSVSACACHELCEMLIDPLCNLWALNRDGKMYAYEMCDAVEDYEFMVNGVAMSDFVYPGFFEASSRGKLDWLGKVKRPFQTTPGGYQIVMYRGQVKEVFGSKKKQSRFKKEDRRLHRSEFRKL